MKHETRNIKHSNATESDGMFHDSCFMIHFMRCSYLIIIICYHQYMNKLIIKIIFYALIIGVAIAGTVLYIKSQPVTMNNEQQTMNNSMGTSATCIITIDGQKYDVESLRSTHTGGGYFPMRHGYERRLSSQT